MTNRGLIVVLTNSLKAPARGSMEQTNLPLQGFFTGTNLQKRTLLWVADFWAILRNEKQCNREALKTLAV